MSTGSGAKRPAMVIETIEGRRSPERPVMLDGTFRKLRADLLSKGIQPPTTAGGPVIRYATLADGTSELDEVIASNAWVHIEKMDGAQWCIGIRIGDDMWHINLGATNPGVKDYARIEKDEVPAMRREERPMRKSANPVLHEGDVQVIGCDCGGCYGEDDTPWVAMRRSTYETIESQMREQVSADLAAEAHSLRAAKRADETQTMFAIRLVRAEVMSDAARIARNDA